MAARKPSITRTRRTKKTEPETTQEPEATDLSAADLIAEHLRVISNTHLTNIVTIIGTRLEEIVTLLGERNTLAEKMNETAGELEVTESTLARLERLEKISGVEGVAGISKRVEALEKLVSTPATPGEVADITAPAKRGRRTNAQIAADNAAAGATVTADPAPTTIVKPAPKTEIVHCKHIGTLERIRPNLDRCTTCGAVLDVVGADTQPPPLSPGFVASIDKVPAPAAQQTVSVPATNGKAAPSVDDVRAVAITFASKHGKEKLAALLREFGATNLTTLPEENRATAMAKIQAGI